MIILKTIISVRGVYPDRCVVYALTRKLNTPSEPLKLNFYLNPASSKTVINSLIRQSGRSGSDYVDAFLSVELPEFRCYKSNSTKSI